MWRSKKFIVAVVMAVVLVGSISGVALAADNGDDSQPETEHGAILERVCEIYQENTGVTIDQEALKDAFAQAQSEMQAAALENHLQSLVDAGEITQEEADQYLEWWESKPDVSIGFDFHGHGGMLGFGDPPAATE
jgi:hypothetical protein